MTDAPPPAPFGDYQIEIYFAGLFGTLPKYPMAYAELEARAAQALPPSVLSYVAGGAGTEHTQRANASAFQHWGLMPRMFAGAAKRDLSVGLFGLRPGRQQLPAAARALPGQLHHRPGVP